MPPPNNPTMNNGEASTVEQIINERLITHESVVGANEPSIQNTTKRFFQFSEAVQQQSKNDSEEDRADKSLLAYHQLLTELSRYEFDLQSGAVVENTCGRELKQYAKMESEVEHAISDTQNDIEALKKTLQQERIRRQQKEEYETISRIINTHRPRDALQKEIAALEAKLNLLNSDAEDASKKVEVRQKQLHLFLSSMQELSSLWAEESNAHEGTQKGGGAISMSRLPSPSNDEMDEDDEEDEEDNDRSRYRGAEEEEEEVNVDGEEGEEGETGETGETGATGEDGNGMDVEEHEEGEEGEEGDVVMGEAQAEDGEILE